MKLLTAKQYVEIYERRLRREHAEDIAKDMKISVGGIYNTYRLLCKYRTEPLKKRYPAYIEALKIINERFPQIGEKKEKLQAQPVEEKTETNVNNYQKLDQAMQTFQEAISQFLIDEVGDIKRENEELKKSISEGKLSNWTSAIKKKLNNNI